jgi:hypothetical protein
MIIVGKIKATKRTLKEPTKVLAVDVRTVVFKILLRGLLGVVKRWGVGLLYFCVLSHFDEQIS